jgi:hypothetical protein
MPEKETLQRVREDAREGKAPSTQAGESYAKKFIMCGKVGMEYATRNRRLPSAFPKPEK